jgi:hypothetical protein
MVIKTFLKICIKPKKMVRVSIKTGPTKNCMSRYMYVRM